MNVEKSAQPPNELNPESSTGSSSELTDSQSLQEAIVIFGWYWLLMEELDLMGYRLG